MSKALGKDPTTVRPATPKIAPALSDTMVYGKDPARPGVNPQRGPVLALARLRRA